MKRIKEAGAKNTEPKRTCTCYPDEDRPFPCPEKFAASDCYEASLIARVEATDAKLAKAREALKPFAEFGDAMLPASATDNSVWVTCSDDCEVNNISNYDFTFGTFRTAARAYRETE